MSDGPTPVPWTAAQARVVMACDVVAAVVVLVAASVAGGRESLADQVVWIDVAVLALVFAAVANGSLFLAARRTVGQRRRRVLPDVVTRSAPAPAADDRARWLWLAGTTRAHVGGCPMIAGKPAQAVTVAAIRSKKLTRCELCG